MESFVPEAHRSRRFFSVLSVADEGVYSRDAATAASLHTYMSGGENRNHLARMLVIGDFKTKNRQKKGEGGEGECLFHASRLLHVTARPREKPGSFFLSVALSLSLFFSQ